MLRTSPSCLRTQLPELDGLQGAEDGYRDLGPAAEPAASQGHGGASCRAGTGETALSHPTAPSAQRWGCEEAVLTLIILSVPARLAPQPAAQPLLPLCRLQAGCSLPVEPRFQLLHK